MVDERDDGGPAFPAQAWDGTVEIDPQTGVSTPFLMPLPGMSLRDWFAGQALAGALAGSVVAKGMDPAVLAEDCYATADAFLKERKR